MTTLRGGGATDVGRVRSNNQDQLLVADTLFAVADGMGGHAAGEVASLAAIESLRAHYDGNRSADGLADAVRAANRVVWERAKQGAELRGMGTTLTAVALIEGERDDDDVLAVVNVGDSRAYLFRDGELEQLTDDHSVPEELRRAGRITDAEAAVHPQRNVLTRALGIEAEVEVDCFQVTPYRGDRLLLASDGLHNEVSDDDIATVLRKVRDPDEAAKRLLAMAKDHGGHDNITVVVVDVVDDDDRSGRASRAVAPSAGRRAPADRRLAEPVAPGTPPAGAPAPTGPSSTGHPPAGSVREPAVAVAAGRRSFPFRPLLFASLVVLVLVAAFGAVAWYGRGGFFVGADGEAIVIFKGRPGGLLWFEPTVADRTDVSLLDVTPARADDIRAGKEEPSLEAARRYVRNVVEEAAPTTSTTVAPALPGSAPTTSTFPAPAPGAPSP